MLISYAQNFEDVMLWRALEHIEQGFYIDIGAQDPVVDSVSLGFYEQGWRGVHVEPTPDYAKALRDARPDESVIQAAIGDKGELIPFFEIPGTGISTGEPDIARRHETQGHKPKRIEVPCIGLSILLDRYQDRDVHWMKIDVEGMELRVLRTWAPSSVRPWVVVIESTLPMSQELSHAAWEPIILGLGYRFAYFDGLNRFYVSERHDELLKSFASPPNVFDSFMLAGTGSNTFSIRLNERLTQAKRDVDELMSQRHRLEEELQRQREGNEGLAHVAELKARAVAQTALAEQRASGAIALAKLVEQHALQMEGARAERLELVRHLGAQNHAHAAQIVGLEQDLRQLRESLGDRDKLVGQLRERWAAEAASASRLREEFVRAERDASTSLDEARRSLDAALALVSAGREESAALRSRLSEEQQLLYHEREAASERQRDAHLARERANAVALNLRSQLDEIAAHWSWRMTQPLRAVFGGPSHPTPTPSAAHTDRRPQSASAAPAAGLSINTAALDHVAPGATDMSTLPTPRHESRHEIRHVYQLLDLHGRQFLEAAYLAVLGRPVDVDGLYTYLYELSQGASKSYVIALLALSPEGLARQQTLPGLPAMVAREKRMTLGFWPRLLRRVFHGLFHDLERQVRAVEYRLIELDALLGAAPLGDSSRSSVSAIGIATTNMDATRSRDRQSAGLALEQAKASLPPTARAIFGQLTK